MNTESGQFREGEEYNKEKQLTEAKRIAQEAGYELRFHAEDGPDEYQVIGQEHGEPIGVYWNTDKQMWGTHVDGVEALFPNIQEAIAIVQEKEKQDRHENDRELSN